MLMFANNLKQNEGDAIHFGWIVLSPNF